MHAGADPGHHKRFASKGSHRKFYYHKHAHFDKIFLHFSGLHHQASRPHKSVSILAKDVSCVYYYPETSIKERYTNPQKRK